MEQLLNRKNIHIFFIDSLRNFSDSIILLLKYGLKVSEKSLKDLWDRARFADIQFPNKREQDIIYKNLKKYIKSKLEKSKDFLCVCSQFMKISHLPQPIISEIVKSISYISDDDKLDGLIDSKITKLQSILNKNLQTDQAIQR